MRRAPIVLSATAVGLGAVLGFKPAETVAPSASASGEGSAPSAPETDATTTQTTGQSAAAKTATGDSIPTRYGNAQVRVTVEDGRITNVEAIELQGNDPKSVEISSSAEPALSESALTRQTADVDVVSGATVTSASYEASLQSALDEVGYVASDGSRGSSEVPEVQEEDHRGW